MMLFIYDSENKTFKLNEEHGGHGRDGKYYPYVLNRIVDIKNDGDEYTVSVKKAFCVLGGHVGYCTDYYKSYNDALNTKNPLFVLKVAEDEDITNLIDYYYPEVLFDKLDNDKLNTYIYKFKKDDNNVFIFKSYTFK